MSETDFLIDDTETADDALVRDYRPWRILVVDDDPQVFAVTKLVARDIEFKGRPVELLSAFSAEDAKAVLAETDDIAVILLDVVMETEHAGLDLIHDIRRDMGNEAVRIILRTGQPGQAPERKVIQDYDINDYRLKSELTEQSLFTAVVSALRAYDLIIDLERHRALAMDTLGHQNLLETQVLDALDQPVLHTDTLGVVTACNQAFARLLGFADAAEVVGTWIEESLPEPMTARLRRRALTPEEIGVPEDGEIALNGGTQVLRTLVYGLNDGSAGGVICVLREEPPAP